MDAVYKINRLALAAACLAVLPCLVIAASEPAHADVVQNFDLNGIFEYQIPSLPVNPTFPFSAQVAIDTTTGTVTSESFFPNNTPGSITFTQGYNAIAQAYLLDVRLEIAPLDYFIFFDAASLVNYAGGNLGSLDNPTPGGAVSRYSTTMIPLTLLRSGSASVAVPEPASGGLLAMAVGAMAMLLATHRRGKGRTRRGEVRLPAPSHAFPAATLG